MQQILIVVIGCTLFAALAWGVSALVRSRETRRGPAKGPANGTGAPRVDGPTTIGPPPEVRRFTSRDGEQVAYRYYPALADNAMIVLAGSDLPGTMSTTLAHFVTIHRLAHVYVVQMSATDMTRKPLGEHSSVGQVPELVMDLIDIVRSDLPEAPIILASSSPTSSVTLRFISGRYGRHEDTTELAYFTARDGEELAYRHYPAQSDTMLILLHGASAHSGMYSALAHFITEQQLAQVYTPNLRGHHRSGSRRGDVAYIGQLEDDLADLISLIRKDSPQATLVLAGHSTGGGLAIRFAAGRYGRLADAYLLLAPYLGYSAPTSKRAKGNGWAMIRQQRMLGLIMLNMLGIRWLNYLPVIRFNQPPIIRDGTETLDYSFRLFQSLSPGLRYGAQLRAISQPLLVLIGDHDEIFVGHRYGSVVGRYTQGQVGVISEATHLGIVFNGEAHQIIRRWLGRPHS